MSGDVYFDVFGEKFVSEYGNYLGEAIDESVVGAK